MLLVTAVCRTQLRSLTCSGVQKLTSEICACTYLVRSSCFLALDSKNSNRNIIVSYLFGHVQGNCYAFDKSLVFFKIRISPNTELELRIRDCRCFCFIPPRWQTNRKQTQPTWFSTKNKSVEVRWSNTKIFVVLLLKIFKIQAHARDTFVLRRLLMHLNAVCHVVHMGTCEHVCVNITLWYQPSVKITASISPSYHPMVSHPLLKQRRQ